jgi:hypothetical protein
MENFLATLLYGHHNVLEGMHEGEPIELGKVTQFDDGSATIENSITTFLHKAQSGLLVKSAGVADSSWDAELTKPTAETDPAALPARSQARLEKAFGVIERVFFGHPQECEEAKSIARRLLLETRAEVTAALVA